MSSLNHREWDCVIIGGGPAGATAATILSDHGRRVALLEASRFPRHHIGESLMPHTYWIFRRIGMLDKLKNSDFPRKESVQFVSASGQESQPFYFSDRDPNEWSTTWQVKRDSFDRMMLENAREHGVEVYEGTRASEVLFRNEKAVGVRATIDGVAKDLHASVVVDASGSAGLISRQLGLRYGDEKLKNAAIYAYFKNAAVDQGRNSGATIVIHTPNRNGWFWFIPLPDDVTSVGVVAPPAYLCAGRGDDPLRTLDDEIAACPAMARRLEHATRVSQAYVTSDFSYRSRRMAGDGWVLIGDAFCFLDPIYSSGLMLAMKSGEYAADAIHAALTAGDVGEASLGRYGDEFVHGVQLLRQLVYAFYDRNFSFAEFVRKHPERQDSLVRLLIGDVFGNDVGGIFDVMKHYTELPPAIEVATGLHAGSR